MNGLCWVPAHGKLNATSLGHRPVEGGRENDGTPLHIAQAEYNGVYHPGKASANLDGKSMFWTVGENITEMAMSSRSIYLLWRHGTEYQGLWHKLYIMTQSIILLPGISCPLLQ